MNLHHLRTFIGVYRAGSISKAAAALGIAQPAASAQLRGLEGELGKPLFVRHARGVRPTPIADELARAVGTRLDGAEAAFERLRARSDTLEGTIHMAGPAEFMGSRMVPVLTALAGAGIDVRARLGGRDAIYRWLADEEIDLAITASEPDHPALGYTAIATERLLLVAAPWLDLSGRPTADWPWIAYDETLPLVRTVLDTYDASVARSARAPIVVPSLTMLRDLVTDGAGVTVLPDYLCDEHIASGELVMVDPSARAPLNTLHLVWRKSALRHPRIVFARDQIEHDLRPPNR